MAFSGNQLRASWSGGGDAGAYVLLGHNLLEGKGLISVLQPAVSRAPGRTTHALNGLGMWPSPAK